jgi:hypothetical protein
MMTGRCGTADPGRHAGARGRTDTCTEALASEAVLAVVCGVNYLRRPVR